MKRDEEAKLYEDRCFLTGVEQSALNGMYLQLTTDSIGIVN